MSVAASTLAEPLTTTPRPLRLVPAHPATPTPQPGTDARVVPLFAPSGPSVAAPVRLTRRGVVVAALLIVALSAALLGLAAHSAPATGRPSAPARLIVHPGDTLWSVATRVAPNADPRVEVPALQRLNHLVDTTLRPGQVLRTR